METTVKAASLVLDWNLWPRFESKKLDSANLRKIKEAIIAGVELPAVIVDKKSKRVVDGFHRTTATLAIKGDLADISAVMKDYKNDLDMFIDAIRYNNVHGLPLCPRDQIHCIIMLRENFGKKIPWEEIGPILGIKDERAKNFYEQRSASDPEGNTVPLTGGSLMLSGRKLTKKEENYRTSSSGILPIVYARMLLKAVDAGLFPETDTDEEIALLLVDKIQLVLSKIEKKKAS